MLNQNWNTTQSKSAVRTSKTFQQTFSLNQSQVLDVSDMYEAYSPAKKINQNELKKASRSKRVLLQDPYVDSPSTTRVRTRATAALNNSSDNIDRVMKQDSQKNLTLDTAQRSYK